MSNQLLPSNLEGKQIYFIGIKGTGMTALAEIFLGKGASVSGSDTDEKFYTDKILDSLKIPYIEGFLEDNVPENVDFIVHSAAYSVFNNPEMKAVAMTAVPVFQYSEALGQLSKPMFSCGISGVHGKTTTTAMAGTILKYLNFPATILAGSGVDYFGGRSSYVGGNKYFVAETCEYKRHFLHFHPDIIVLTNIETDHMDYFKDYNDIEDSFISYMKLLPSGGRLIYCADDNGARNAAAKLNKIRPDIRQIAYGETALSSYRISIYKKRDGINAFKLEGFDCEFTLKIPGKHLVLDAAAAVALTVSILEEEGREPDINNIASGLASFTGSKRRSEIKGEYKGILFMDDYGHHPTEITATLKGLREFYPDKRIIADFMSHTYSRTEAFFQGFSSCFSDADIVVLHRIYSSAREKEGLINGRSLFEETKKNHNKVYYFHEISDSFNFYVKLLQEDDLFITIGAGNNWIIGEQLIKHFREAWSQTSLPGRNFVAARPCSQRRRTMKSMTGYGWIDTQNESMQMSVELKSYNNRYLDININMPPFMSPLEPELRVYLKDKINRGRVELYVRVKELEEDIDVIPDTGVVTAYRKALEQISEAADLDEKPRLSHFLHLDGVMKVVKKRNIDKYKIMLFNNLDKAWVQYDEIRTKEGDATWEDIMSNIDVLWKSWKIIKNREGILEDLIKSNIKERFQQLLDDKIDENRVLSETAMLLMKYGIGEELSRLSSHLEQFCNTLHKEVPVAKKLDFLCQEMNREINTIGSKSNLLEISQAVIEAKDAVEKIREQLRNVE